MIFKDMWSHTHKQLIIIYDVQKHHINNNFDGVTSLLPPNNLMQEDASMTFSSLKNEQSNI